MHVDCKGSEEGEERVKTYRAYLGQITIGNLTSMKSKLGYQSRDYMYYKKRNAEAPAEATLNEIEFDFDVDTMIKSNEEDRKVRIVLSRNPIADPSVAITPIKSNRVSSNHEEEEEVQESNLDAYKDWLAYMHTRNQAMGELWYIYLHMDFAIHS